MTELNGWQQRTILSILSFEDVPITLVKDYEEFVDLFFNRKTYKVVQDLIEAEEWKKLRENNDSCETDFREYISIIKFKNQNDQNYTAIIYDSDELWQDPEVIEIFQMK